MTTPHQHERICRFCLPTEPTQARIGAVAGSTIVDLSASGVTSLASVLEADNPSAAVVTARESATTQYPIADVRLLPPVERQEVWAAGVTYLRSKTARIEESDFSGLAYDRVYEANRPELFFKALAEKVVGPDDGIGIRFDARWNVPEPELALVMNSAGDIVGYTIGNDVSSRDIEGENLLYLPQAKVYDRSCSLGPWIVLGPDEGEARTWSITIAISRDGREVFAGQTSVDQLKRSFSELVNYLWRSQSFPHGVVLLTGTGVVPDESFTLAAEDRVLISIEGIGELANTVQTVGKTS
jgi:2-dehydro-3-deoxy-D-arabinonate dehydratase